MPTIVLLILTAFLFSCGKQQSRTSVYSVHTEFEPYLQNFKYLALANAKIINTSNIIIRFNDNLMDNNILGVCIYGGPTPIIEIDKSEWNEMSQARREHLLWHEYAHCLLHRGHNETIKDGKPISIMYPYLFDTWYYENYYDEYIFELFYPDTLSGKESLKKPVDKNTETRIECIQGEKNEKKFITNYYSIFIILRKNK